MRYVVGILREVFPIFVVKLPILPYECNSHCQNVFMIRTMFEKFELVQNMVIYSYNIYSIDERYLNKLCCWDSWSYLVVLGRTWSTIM